MGEDYFVYLNNCKSKFVRQCYYIINIYIPHKIPEHIGLSKSLESVVFQSLNAVSLHIIPMIV